MADEKEEHVETFESADAGASLTYPQQAGTIRKNGFIVINNRPCKVADVSTSKTGKHGHAKCHFVAIDIFTNKKYEDLTPSSHNCDVPNIHRKEYMLVDITEENFVSLMDQDNGSIRDDLMLPKGTEDMDKLAVLIRENFEKNLEMALTVTKAMGDEMISSLKVINATADK